MSRRNEASTFNSLRTRNVRVIQRDVRWISIRVLFPSPGKINKNNVAQTLAVHPISLDHNVRFAHVTMDISILVQ